MCSVPEEGRNLKKLCLLFPLLETDVGVAAKRGEIKPSEPICKSELSWCVLGNVHSSVLVKI